MKSIKLMKSILHPLKLRILKHLLVRFFYIVLIMSNCDVFSTEKTDSLILVISNQAESIDKVNNLYLLASFMSQENLQEAIRYCDQANLLANGLEDKDGMNRAYYWKGIIYADHGIVDSAKHYLGNYLALRASQPIDSLLTEAYLEYGIQLLNDGQYDSAVYCFRLPLNYFKTISDTFNLIVNYNSLGVAFKYLTEYDSALIYYQQALELCEAASYDEYIGYMLINIGKMYQKRSEYDKAKKYLERSLEMSTKFNDLKNLALTNNILGNVANEKMDQEMALDYYKEAEKIYRQLKDTGGITDVQLNYGEIYHMQKKYQLALQNYKEALKYYERSGNNNGIIIAKTNIGATYVKLKRFDEAKALLEECLQLTTKSNDDHNRSLVYSNLSDLGVGKGDYKMAFDYQTKYMTLNDTIFEFEKEKEVLDLEARYQKKEAQAKLLAMEKEKVEKELELKKSENTKRVFLISGISAIVILLLIFAYHKNASNKNKVIAEQKIKQLEEEKKLLAARSIVVGHEQERKRIAKELHDGLGVLLSTAKMQFTTIKDKSPENRPLIDKASKLLEQAAGDVRKISHNMMPGLLTRFGFYEAAEDLFEKIDDTEGLSTRATILGDKKRLPENTEIMLYRIVQELANNTIKHAKATEMTIDIVILPEQLSIDYSDNGKGFDVEQKLASKSIGMTSIQSRVKFLNGNMDLQSKAGEGVNYHITIPIQRGKKV